MVTSVLLRVLVGLLVMSIHNQDKHCQQQNNRAKGQRCATSCQMVSQHSIQLALPHHRPLQLCLLTQKRSHTLDHAGNMQRNMCCCWCWHMCTATFSTLIMLPMLHSCNQTRSSWPDACATQHSTSQPSPTQHSTGAGQCSVPRVNEAGFPADPQAGGPAVCMAGVAGLDGPPGS